MASCTEQPNEAEFIALVQRGDSTAIEVLFRAYFDRLYSLVFNQVGRDQDVAEDIVQETFLSAIDSASRFRGLAKPYTWLCSIAHHKVIDYYRRQHKEARRKVEDINIDAIEPVADSSPPFESVLESEERRHGIEKALRCLPPDYRQVLIFKYIEDMSVIEISRIMRRSAKSVEGLLTRSRRALQTLVSELGEGL
jgi:RNA polymerase sigma-70 factor, ECF subfamily